RQSELPLMGTALQGTEDQFFVCSKVVLEILNSCPQKRATVIAVRCVLHIFLCLLSRQESSSQKAQLVIGRTVRLTRVRSRRGQRSQACLRSRMVRNKRATLLAIGKV